MAENIFLPQSIIIELEPSNKEFFFLDVIDKMEEQAFQLLKSSIFKNLLAFSKYSLDYVSLFKTLTAKQTFFQSLYVLNDIYFFYELTCILKRCESQQRSFDSYLRDFYNRIFENMIAFIDFLRKQLPSALIKTFNNIGDEFIIQIMGHLEIVNLLIEQKIQVKG